MECFIIATNIARQDIHRICFIYHMTGHDLYLHQWQCLLALFVHVPDDDKPNRREGSLITQNVKDKVFLSFPINI